MLRFVLIMAASIPLCAPPSEVGRIPLPADLSGTLDGTAYRIRVPGNWNGTLLVYCHGSSSGVLQVAPGTFPVSSPSLEEQLLSQGYALAGSFYEDSTKEAPLRTLALTNFFNGHIGKPRRTIMSVFLLGGTVTLDLIENHYASYDGAIAVSPVAAGSLNDADWELRFDLAYAAVSGGPRNRGGRSKICVTTSTGTRRA